MTTSPTPSSSALFASGQSPADPSSPPSSQDWLEVARLLRPQGRRGELLAEPSADLDLFTPGLQLALSPHPERPTEPPRWVKLLAAWQPTGRNAGRLVLELAQSRSISEAEALAGQFLLLQTTALPPLPEDTYRVRDLVGCSLFDEDRLLGTVTDLQFPVNSDGQRLVDAPDLLVVQPVTASDMETTAERSKDPEAPESPEAADDLNDPDTATEPVLVPFVRAWLLEVDLPAQRIRMQLPAGLFAGDTD